MFLILFVLHDTEKLDSVLDAWEKAGASGVTVLPSIGFARYKEKRALQEDFPLIPGLENIIESVQNQNRTLFTIVLTEGIKDEIISTTTKIIGDLNRPNTGILVVLPVSQAFGLNSISE
jgi:hypothetical protein